MEKEKKNGNYLTGIIGAILGGLIATIPWVLMYVYGNMMLSLLAVIIAAGEFYGYKLFKGKIDKKLPALIMILAVIIVTIVTLLVIPAMLLAKENIPVTFQTIKNLYTYNDFSTAIIRDYVISVLFTILGASVVTSNVKKQLLNNENNVKLDLSNNEAEQKMKQDAINTLKPIFEKFNATNKDNTMTKEEVIAELENKNQETYFNYLKNLKIIKKSQGKYYYDAEGETNIKSNNKSWKISISILAVLLIFASIFSNIDEQSKKQNEIENNDVNFAISSDWNTYQEYNEEDGWTYYKYITNYLEPANNEEVTNTIDYTKYPSTIAVAYDTEVLYDSIDDLKTSVEEYITALEPSEYNVEKLTTKKGYEAIKAKMTFETYPEEVDYWCYIYKDGKLGYITASTFNMQDDKELEKETMNILNSFEWKD